MVTDRVHIAVATRQKSTARRLVSSMPDSLRTPSGVPRAARGDAPPGDKRAVLEATYQMVFTGGTAVTLRCGYAG
jgi:hypothetical protein